MSCTRWSATAVFRCHPVTTSPTSVLLRSMPPRRCWANRHRRTSTVWADPRWRRAARTQIRSGCCATTTWWRRCSRASWSGSWSSTGSRRRTCSSIDACLPSRATDFQRLWWHETVYKALTETKQTVLTFIIREVNTATKIRFPISFSFVARLPLVKPYQHDTVYRAFPEYQTAAHSWIVRMFILRDGYFRFK